MKTIETTRTISAPIEHIFQIISDPQNFSKAVPHIKKIEFLSNQQSGVGTRFRETREMNGKDSTVELEVAEFVPNEKIRMISDAGGTVWDSVFTLKQSGPNVEMHMAMEAKPHKLMARAMNMLIRGLVVKGVESDMDAIKAYCENGGN